MLASPWLSFWECWEYSFNTESLGIWGALTPTNGIMSQKKREQCWKKDIQYQSFQKSLCIWIFCWSSSQFLSTKKGFTWHGDYTDKKQNTKTSSISLGEITVICRQNPQVTTYNHCQVFTATLLLLFKPFSFLNTEQWCSTMQVKSFKAMGQNFSFLWHRSKVLLGQDTNFQIVSVWAFGEGFSKELHSDVTLLLSTDSKTCTDFGGTP